MRFRAAVSAVIVFAAGVSQAGTCETYVYSTPVAVKTARSATSAEQCQRLRELAVVELRSNYDAAVIARNAAFDAQKAAESNVYRCSSDASCAAAREQWKKTQDRLATADRRVRAAQSAPASVGRCECMAARRPPVLRAAEPMEDAGEDAAEEDVPAPSPAPKKRTVPPVATAEDNVEDTPPVAKPKPRSPAAARERATPQAVKSEVPAPRTPGAKGQPKLVALPVEKCVGCTSKLRKRVAVMPVKVGALASELNMAPEAVATLVRDKLEAQLGTMSGLAVLSRSELGDVVAEQRISDSPLANQELAPAKGKIIPAQYLVYATVDRVDVHDTTTKETNSTAEQYEQSALQTERRADNLDAEADQTENERVNSTTGAWLGVVCSTAPLFCSGQGQAYLDCLDRARQKQEECNERARQEQERALERKRQENSREANGKRNKAAELRREAQRQRQQAAIEAQQNVTVTETKRVTAAMVWRAIDTSTSAVFASGSETGKAEQMQRGISQSSAYRSSSVTDSSRYQVVVNSAVADVVSQLAKVVEQKVATEPFRAKVVSFTTAGVVINAGMNLGMAVGDTFGVRKRQAVLTDPDTGLPLETPGPPVGVIRVSEVHEKTAFAQIVNAAGTIARGDELEWIGMFAIVAPATEEPAGTPRQ